MTEIGQQIIKAVREAAARNPLHVHRGACLYVLDGKPCCLIGHALWDLGLISPSTEHTYSNDEGVVAFIEGTLGIMLDAAELQWLELAQTAQDKEMTWASAIREADEFDEANLATW